MITGSEVHIDIFDDRMEIYSPGGMMDGSLVQDLNTDTVPSKRRNPVIADVFSRMNYMERRGSGFKKIKADYHRAVNFREALEPQFYSDRTNFIVTLFNLNYGVAVEKSIPPEKKQSFDEPETILEERKQSFMHLLKGLGFKPKTAAHVLALYQHYGTQQCFKFRDILRSGKALAELSDQICTEHNLSVITEPKSKDQSYDPELITKGEITARDTLRMSIDAALRMRPDGFDALMQLLEDAGCWIKRGAQISIKPSGGKRFIRLDTVGTEYSEKVLRLTLAGKHVHIPKQARSKMPHAQIELLINIEAKMRAGKGKGYERWAERHNTDVLASSMLYLIDNRISSYAELEHKIHSAVDRRTELKSAITSAQARMQEISKQKKAILVYRRTKDVYTQYRESGWSPAFYREHKADIEAHKEAQAVYSAAGGKLPTLSELSEEYNLLLSQKKQAGEQLSQLSEELKNLRHIKSNMDTLLDDERFEEKQTQRMRDTEPEHEQHTTGKDR